MENYENLKWTKLPKDEIHKMIYDLLNDRQRKTLEETKELDFSMDMGKYGRFRVNCFYQQRGEAAVFRTIPTEILSFRTAGSAKHLPENI